MSDGTKVTATDLTTGESESQTIKDDFILITDGRCYLAHAAVHANGTKVLTVKVRGAKEGQ